ncbi:potassium channel subfamily K member 18-like, partial [Stegodyphus dumicola]|uniref:potassium channel subfamily K member 18-like n=1 Tax=Stegodyphus dumicola TaxID=202533 RepID=UPI0015B295FC
FHTSTDGSYNISFKGAYSEYLSKCFFTEIPFISIASFYAEFIHLGYGNIAPKTNWGKLVTILYAIFGIPLMFLYLTNIGNILAKSFKYVYGRICYRRRLGDQRRRRQQQLEQYQIHHIMLQDATSPNTGTNSIVDSSTLIRNKLNSDLPKDDLDDEASNNYSTKPRVTVPITLCLAIIAGYICGGAAIFSVWEGWDYLDGSYFCFVTLSTIGFGDLVPGDSVVSDDGTQEKLVICSLYLLAGMALIAMCFNLVQEEVVFKLRRIGRSLGLLSDHNDSDD